MKRKGKVLLLIALILGVGYCIYSFSYWSGVGSRAATDSEAIGAGIASMLVLPHLVVVGIAVLFNILAFFMYNRPFALVAAILYTVGLALFPAYFMFVIVEMVLCYIAFAKMKQ